MTDLKIKEKGTLKKRERRLRKERANGQGRWNSDR